MKIFCIGRNYVDHAKELKNPIPSQPLVFMKPPTSMMKKGADFYIPEFSKEIHYEVELVLKVAKNGKHIQHKYAPDYYSEVALGIDFTARDVQQKCKEKGHPWEVAKGFDNSALVSSFLPYENGINSNLDFSLKKNDEVVQVGQSKDMIFDFNELIVHLSKFFTLQKGDLIFTGTPAGVGKLDIGDKLEGFLEDRSMFHCNIK